MPVLSLSFFLLAGPNRDAERQLLAKKMESKTDPNSVISHSSFVPKPQERKPTYDKKDFISFSILDISPFEKV